MALKDRHLPPVEGLVSDVFGRLDGLESVKKDYCRAKDIDFISLTESLREAILMGKRAYFTYDQHISPEGHQSVAEQLAEQIP